MHDKDIDEGKMWFYYIYVMCDKIKNAEEDLFERHYSKYEDDDEEERYGNYRRMGRSSYGRRKEYDREYDERDFEREREKFFSYGRRIQTWSFCALHQILIKLKSILK